MHYIASPAGIPEKSCFLARRLPRQQVLAECAAAYDLDAEYSVGLLDVPHTLV